MLEKIANTLITFSVFVMVIGLVLSVLHITFWVYVIGALMAGIGMFFMLLDMMTW